MPDGWLMVMFRLGDQLALSATLTARARAALADGNPALDDIGVCGGAMLRPIADGSLQLLSTPPR